MELLLFGAGIVMGLVLGFGLAIISVITTLKG